MQILYREGVEPATFDSARYLDSLRRYGEIDEELANKIIKEELEPHQVRHVSVLVENAVPLFKEEEAAKNYYRDHLSEDVGFERLRRITGRTR